MSEQGQARLSLRERPEARILKVEDILKHVLQGKVRVPPFQRPLRWQSKEVVGLLDSIYRGYPIGDLLFLQESAKAADISFGSRVIQAPARADVWMVVDGQQRIAALAGSMLHPELRPRGDIYAIWFDLVEERFCWAPPWRDVPDMWIPVRALADTRDLHRWWSQWPLRSEHEELLDRVFEVSKLIREYEIPTYILHDAPEEVVRDVFRRVNGTGTRMKESEVFDALRAVGDVPKPLKVLSERLKPLGYGDLGEALRLRCVKAAMGADPAEDLSDGRSIEISAIADAIGHAVAFLKEEVGVPHAGLSPYFVPLLVLSRLFAVFSSIPTRDRLLLRRWVWRGFLNGAHGVSGHATVRRLQGVGQLETPSQAAAALLADLKRRYPTRSPPLDPSRPWVGTAAEIKLAQIALLNLGARRPATGEVVGPVLVRSKLDRRASGGITVGLPGPTPDTVAGRFLLLDGRTELDKLKRCDDEQILSSHALSSELVLAWRAGDLTRLLAGRGEILRRHMAAFFDSRAEWDDNDRPSIDVLVKRAAEVTHARP